MTISDVSRNIVDALQHFLPRWHFGPQIVPFSRQLHLFFNVQLLPAHLQTMDDTKFVEHVGLLVLTTALHWLPFEDRLFVQCLPL